MAFAARRQAAVTWSRWVIARTSSSTGASPSSNLALAATAQAMSSLATGSDSCGSRFAGSRSSGGYGFASSAVLASTALAATATVHADAKQGESTAAPDVYARPAVTHGLPKDVTLYQYEVCPYCCKVKAFLDYHKIPYRVVEVNPMFQTELKWSTYKKVPVMQSEKGVVNDSSAIISALAAEVEAAAAAEAAKGRSKSKAPSKKELEAAQAAAEEERRWRAWTDERMVKVLTANIYRNWEESWQTFDYITQQTNWSYGMRELARVGGAVIMWMVGGRMPKKYGIEGDLRTALYACLDEFVAALNGRAFMGGAAPNLADLAVFGVLRAVETTPTWADAMAHSKIAPWYERMRAAVGPSAALRQPPAAA